MSMQDLLSDFVARVNNASMVGNTSTVVLKNKIVENVCKKLTSLGYFKGFDVGDRDITVHLNLEKITKLIRISKPGHRSYVSFRKSPKIIGGVGFNILSTSKGVMTHIESAKASLGGEILFQIY